MRISRQRYRPLNTTARLLVKRTRCPEYNPGLYTVSELDKMIFVDGYIPVATAAEFDKIRTGNDEIMGEGTCWEGTYTTGGDKKYVQVLAIDFTSFGSWSTAITTSPGFIYDANEILISNISSTDMLFTGAGLELKNARFANCSLSSVNRGVGLIYSGNGLTVSNLEAVSITVVSTGFVGATSSIGGLFGDIGGIVDVDGIYFDGSVTGERNVIGGVFGSVGLTAAASGTIQNVSNSPTTTVVCTQVGTYGIIGGIGGIVRGYNAINCTNNSDISGAVRTGGLFGDANTTVSGCVNNGNISAINGGCAGVIGLIANGTVTVSGCVNNGDIDGSEDVGGIISRITSGSDVYRCVNTGDITGNVTTNPCYVGGIAGAGGIGSNSSECRECYVSDCNISGGFRAGGLIGSSVGTDVTDCYVSDTVDVSGGGQYTAGLIGATNGNSSNSIVENCYSAATISSGTGQGGLIGNSFSGTLTVTDSYWDTVTSGQATSAGGTGKTTSELQTPTSNTGIYANWDPLIWNFGTSSEYPKLINTP